MNANQILIKISWLCLRIVVNGISVNRVNLRLIIYQLGLLCGIEIT